MAPSITALSITTLSTMTLSITTLSMTKTLPPQAKVENNKEKSSGMCHTYLTRVELTANDRH